MSTNKRFAATQQALGLLEIRAIILEHLSSRKHRLLNMCLLNKTWFEESSTILWRKFKAPRRKIGGRTAEDTVYDLSKISKDRQQLYAFKLRHICLESDEACQIYTRLELPNVNFADLRGPNMHLDQRVGGEWLLPFLSVIRKLQEQLETVWIRGKFDERLLVMLRQCPKLKHLMVGDLAENVTPDQLLCFIRECEHLQSVHLSDWPAIWPRFFSVDTLAFYLRSSRVPCTFSFESVPSNQLWQALELPLELKPEQEDPQPVGAVSFTAYASGKVEDRENNIVCILPFLAKMRNLEQLSFFAGDLRIARAEHLLALTRLNFLRRLYIGESTFELDGMQIPDFDDACVENLTRGLPLLEELGLYFDESPSDREQVTTESLDSISRNCPQMSLLHLVGLSFDLSGWTLDDAPRFPRIREMRNLSRNWPSWRKSRKQKGLKSDETTPTIDASGLVQLLKHHMPRLGLLELCRSLLSPCCGGLEPIILDIEPFLPAYLRERFAKEREVGEPLGSYVNVDSEF